MKKKTKSLKLDQSASIRFNSYKIISDTIENGIRYGYNRSFKHTDKPDEELVIDEIHRSIMNDLCDILDFDDPNE